MGLGSVFKALTSLTVGTTKGTVKGATKIGVAAGHDVINIARKSFTRDTGSYLEGLKSGKIIPIHMKGGAAAVAFGGLTVAGLGNGAANGVTQDSTSDDPDVEQVNIPNAIDMIRSPRPRVDDMGANGNIVLGAHNRR